jgi:23S rRNA (guanine745-N1)-methyltransferase
MDGATLIKKSTILICPICKQSLNKSVEERLYKCDYNHSYDIAKQGYTNLLISNQKKSNHPGESKEMIRIRREFLDKGYYQSVSDELNKISNEFLIIENGTVLDLGCGEGYYLNQMEQFFLTNHKNLDFYGLDISKEALKLASIRNKSIEWVVSSSFAIPFKEKSIDLLLSVFSPISDDECKRLIAEEGCFIRVLPNSDHLIELREIIYDKLEERREGRIMSESLKCVYESKVKYSINLKQDDLLKLLQMTPHYWKTSPENKKKVLEIKELSVTIDMNVSVFRR